MTPLVDYDPLAAPGTYPIPAGRGRWRLTLHNRSFVTAASRWDQTIIGELSAAHSRQLVQEWNSPAALRFTMNGRDPSVAAVTELANDVYAWRWDDRTGTDVCVFRGVIDHSEDHLSEQTHTVNFVAHDYLAILKRRYVTTGQSNPNWVLTNMDQDSMVGVFVLNARLQAAGNGTSLQPGSVIPLQTQTVNPDGSTRGLSGRLRTRTYFGGQNFGEAIDNLAAVANGFDFDCRPNPAGLDNLRIFYPSQGVARSDMMFNYGGTIAALTRTVNSGDYANYSRRLGNNGSSDPMVTQLYAENWNSDAVGGQVGSPGLWMTAIASSDVNQQGTLNEQAAGDVARMGILVPSYSLTMRPGAYSWGYPNMGDTVPLVIQSGRLNVNTTVRVVGITYDVGDDGDEDIEITVGRPLSSLGDLLARTSTAVDALARR